VNFDPVTMDILMWNHTHPNQPFGRLYHGLCGSNKLLYKRCAKSMGRPKFRPPTAPTFFNRFSVPMGCCTHKFLHAL